MTPEVSYLIPGSLEDTYKYIEVPDRHHVMEKQKGQVRIQMCDDNGKTFIATLYYVLLAPDLCDSLFSINLEFWLEEICRIRKWLEILGHQQHP